MSLIRPVVRMTAVAALRGITIADVRVYDTDNTPLNDAVKSSKQPLPYITVYTDEDIRSNIQSKGVFLADREIALVIEIGVKAPVTFKTPGDPDNDTQDGVIIPDSDAGFELSVDLLEGQVINALFGSPRSDWADLFKSLVMKVIRVPSVRGAQGGDGARWAARQLTFRLDVIADAPDGVPLDDGHSLRRFIALARSDTAAKLAPAAAVIEGALASPATLAAWEQIQAWGGMTRQGIDAIGMAPVATPITMPQDEEGALLAVPEEDDTDQGGVTLGEASTTVTTMPNGDIVPDYLFPKG